MVESCPIAYVGVDDRVHLTNVEGSFDVELDGPRAEGRVWFSYSPPMWSPDGEFIAYQVADGPDDVKQIAVLDPWSDRSWLHATGPSGRFSGWIDGRYWVEHARVRHATTGHDVRQFSGSGWHVAPTVTGGGTSLIAHPAWGISILDETRGQNQVISSARASWVPRMDPTGSWVAWTSQDREQVRRRLNQQRFGSVIAVKAVNDPPETEPRYVGVEFSGASFCDWTDDGLLLVNVQENRQWSLVIMDKQGNVLRRIPTDVPPAPESGASWRRATPSRE